MTRDVGRESIGHRVIRAVRGRNGDEPQSVKAVRQENAIAPEGDMTARLKAVAERDPKDVAEFRAKIFHGETQWQKTQANEAQRREVETSRFTAVLDQSRAADRARLAGTRIIQQAATPAELKRGARVLQEAVTTGMAAKLDVASQLRQRKVNGRGGGGEGTQNTAVAEKGSRRVLAMLWDPDAKSVSAIEQYRFNREASGGYDRRQVVLPSDVVGRSEYIEVDMGHNFAAHYRKLGDGLSRVDAEQSFRREKEQGSLLGTSELKILPATFFELVPDPEWKKVPQHVKDADGAVLKVRDFTDFSHGVQ